MFAASVSTSFAPVRLGSDSASKPRLIAITEPAVWLIASAERSTTEVPETFALAPNYPNPFNPSTALAYALPRPASVRLTVYDALGRHVRTLVESEQPAGSYTVRWDGHDDAGRPVPSGVYLYRIIAGDFVQARTMLLVK